MGTRTIQLRIRLTPEEREYIHREAEDAGLTVSDFIRRRALGKKIVSRVDRHLLNEVRRLGGLQKHLAAQYPAQREEFGRVLNAVLAVLKKVA